jgi:hypothetical protein
MQITGIITAIEPKQSGISQKSGNQWEKQTFVITEEAQRFPMSVAFDVFGTEKLQKFNLQLNQRYTVDFDIRVREYNGRHYNEIQAFNVTSYEQIPPVVQQQVVQQPVTQQPMVQQPTQYATSAQPTQQNSNNDLPF